MEKEKDYILLKSYKNIWKVEKRIEQIGGISVGSLPIEMVVYVLIAYVVEFLIISIFSLKLPMIVTLSLPAIIGIALDKLKIEGKMPIAFIETLLKYAFSKKMYSRCKEINKKIYTSYKYNNKIIYKNTADITGLYNSLRRLEAPIEEWFCRQREE